MSYPDSTMRRILRDVKTIAAIGVSPNPVRPSHFVYRYMQLKGYRMIPVNPVYAGQELFGAPILADLSELPSDTQVDMVDVFRRSEFVAEVYASARQHLPGLKVFWTQIGVRDDAVAAKAEAAGIEVIQDRCPKMEYQRLFGELRNAGINTRVISSKLPPT